MLRKKSQPIFPKSWTTVTPFSKKLALVLFFLLPILAFCLGRSYEKSLVAPGFCTPGYSLTK